MRSFCGGVGLGRVLRSSDRKRGPYSHGPVSSAALRYPSPIITIDRVCPQAIFPTRVTGLLGMLCVTNIGSRHRNSILFRTERATLVKVVSRYGRFLLRCEIVKWKNCQFREYLIFDPSYLGQMLTIRPTSARPIASIMGFIVHCVT